MVYAICFQSRNLAPGSQGVKYLAFGLEKKRHFHTSIVLFKDSNSKGIANITPKKTYLNSSGTPEDINPFR